MATVRTTVPRAEGKGGGQKKRKRSSGSGSGPSSGSGPGSRAPAGGAELSGLRSSLRGVEKWQLAVSVGPWALCAGFTTSLYGAGRLTEALVDMSEIRKECMGGEEAH